MHKGFSGLFSNDELHSLAPRQGLELKVRPVPDELMFNGAYKFGNEIIMPESLYHTYAAEMQGKSKLQYHIDRLKAIKI